MRRRSMVGFRGYFTAFWPSGEYGFTGLARGLPAGYGAVDHWVAALAFGLAEAGLLFNLLLGQMGLEAPAAARFVHSRGADDD